MITSPFWLAIFLILFICSSWIFFYWFLFSALWLINFCYRIAYSRIIVNNSWRIPIGKEKVIVKTNCAQKWFLLWFLRFFFSLIPFKANTGLFLSTPSMNSHSTIDFYIFKKIYSLLKKRIKKNIDKKQKWCEHSILKGAYFTRISCLKWLWWIKIYISKKGQKSNFKLQ